MTIARLKAKNQVTIPSEIVKKLNLKRDELFRVDLEGDYIIKLIPVDIEPRYTSEELASIDHLVAKEKKRARALKPGKAFSKYIKKIAK